MKEKIRKEEKDFLLINKTLKTCHHLVTLLQILKSLFVTNVSQRKVVAH